MRSRIYLFRYLLVLLAFPLVTASMPTRASDDFRDVGYITAKLQRVLEYESTGTSVDWRNPGTGNGGTISILRTYQAGGGTYCRDYRRTTTRGTAVEGTGCRTGPRHWRITEKTAPPKARIRTANTRSTSAVRSRRVAHRPRASQPTDDLGSLDD